MLRRRPKTEALRLEIEFWLNQAWKAYLRATEGLESEELPQPVTERIKK